MKGGILKDDYKFGLSVERLVPYNDDQSTLNTSIITSVLTRYFDGEKYSEKGY